MAIVFDTVSAKHLIRNLLHIPEELFQVQAGYVKYKSYTTVHVMGNIKIYSDCMPNEKNPYGLGSYMVLSGKGCDQLRTYLESDGRNYADFFKMCIERYGKQFHFTRIDVAIDDRNMIPYFTIEKIKEKCSNHEFLSKSRNFRFQESSFQDGSTALTIYIGDRKSRISYRFYDKDKEQAGKTNIPLSIIGTWKRTEIELKDEVAQSFIEKVAEKERGLGELASDFFGANLRFVDYDDNQKNKSRWKTSQFWSDFVGDIKPLKIVINSKQSTLHETQLWLKNGGVLSAVKAFEILEVNQALGDLTNIETLKQNMQFSQELSEKIVTHLTIIGREDIIPYIHECTKKIEFLHDI